MSFYLVKDQRGYRMSLPADKCCIELFVDEGQVPILINSHNQRVVIVELLTCESPQKAAEWVISGVDDPVYVTPVYPIPEE